MHRQPAPDVKPVDVVTRDLTTWPKDKKMETAAPATITQPGSILRGIGMRGDLDTKVLELLSDVHATLEPQARTPRGRNASSASRWSRSLLVLGAARRARAEHRRAAERC